MAAETVTLVSATVSTITLADGIVRGKLRIADVSGTPVDLWMTVGPTNGAAPVDPVADASGAILVPAEQITAGVAFEMDIAPGITQIVVKLLQVGTQKLCVSAT